MSQRTFEVITMIFERDIQMLTKDGFERADIYAHPAVFEEFLKVLGEFDEFKGLMGDVCYIIMIMHDDTLTIVEALEWLLAPSRYLEAVPIRYLAEKGDRDGRDAVVLAADAYLSDLHGAQTEDESSEPIPSNVVPLAAARANKLQKR